MADLRGADIEIIERRKNGQASAKALVPNEVRINGVPVAIPADTPIRVHDITDNDVVTVTLTIFVNSLSVRSEDA